jgi:hypothetical protein
VAGQNLGERIDEANSRIKDINTYLIGISLVMVLGFITLLVTVTGLVLAYQHDSQDVYKQSRDATYQQNEKIDQLIETIQPRTN